MMLVIVWKIYRSRILSCYFIIIIIIMLVSVLNRAPAPMTAGIEDLRNTRASFLPH